MTQGIYHSLGDGGLSTPVHSLLCLASMEPSLPLSQKLSGGPRALNERICVYVQMNKCPDHLECSCFSDHLLSEAKT